MALTLEDTSVLCEVFDISHHSLRDGSGNTKLVYLEEEPIIMRLLKVDPSYELGEPIILNGKDGNISIKISLTVKGVTRWGIGVASEKSYTNEPTKDAVTDAFKRAARCFGVGLYLKGAKNLKSSSDLQRWLTNYNSAPQQSPPQQKQEKNPFMAQAQQQQFAGAKSEGDWKTQLKDKTKALYTTDAAGYNEYHHNNSLKKAIETKEVNYDMTPTQAAKIIETRKALI